MYESPAYWDLKRHIDHWKRVREYVDLARTCRAMSFGGALTLSSTNDQYCQDGAHEITIKDVTRKEVLEFLARRYEDEAAKLDASVSQNIDIREACKV